MQKPRYSSRAHRDLIEIADYICRDNPIAALGIVDRIEAACVTVTADPERGLMHDDLSRSLLVFAVGNYLIVYRVDDNGTLILRVVHAARDLTQLFPNE